METNIMHVGITGESTEINYMQATTSIVALSAIVIHSLNARFGKPVDTEKLISSINAGIGRMDKGESKGSKLNNGSYSAKNDVVKFVESTGQEYISSDVSVKFLVWHNQQVKSLKQWGSIGADGYVAVPVMFNEFLSKHFVVKDEAKPALVPAK